MLLIDEFINKVDKRMLTSVENQANKGFFIKEEFCGYFYENYSLLLFRTYFK